MIPWPTVQALTPGQAHVWWARAAPSPAEERYLLSLLNADELGRHGRFHFLADRHSYLCAHGLLRRMLSALLGGAAGGWKFRDGDHGRPELDPASGGDARVDFNISHTRGMVACALVAGARVGVDVERAARSMDWESLAGAVLSEPERVRILALPAPDRPVAFLRYWTIKEAAAKASGEGLGVDFRTKSIVEAEGESKIDGYRIATFELDNFLLSVALSPGAFPAVFRVAEAPPGWNRGRACGE